MSNASVSISPQSLAAAKRVTPPTAARTKLLLEGPILPTLLRLAAPNVLNLLAFAGVITFDGFFLGRIGTNALAGASLAPASRRRWRARSARGAATAPTRSSSTRFSWRS